MYEVTVFDPYGMYETILFDFPPAMSDERRILESYPDGSWVDIGRSAPPDGACDSLNFRDEVEYELETCEEQL